MNIVCLSGFTTRSVASGKDHLLFTLVTKHGYNKKKEEDFVEFVPCYLSNPSEKIRDILLQEGLFLEFKGRISTSRYDQDGEMKYSTQVIVDASSINLIK